MFEQRRRQWPNMGLAGNNLSGAAERFATQIWAYMYGTQKYVGVAVFGMENSTFSHLRMLNC